MYEILCFTLKSYCNQHMTVVKNHNFLIEFLQPTTFDFLKFIIFLSILFPNCFLVSRTNKIFVTFFAFQTFFVLISKLFFSSSIQFEFVANEIELTISQRDRQVRTTHQISNDIVLSLNRRWMTRLYLITVLLVFVNIILRVFVTYLFFTSH